MTEKTPLDELRQLVNEASHESYDPRAKKCWPWSHQWTMWKERNKPGFVSLKCQMRHCVKCGKMQEKDFF